MGIYLPSQVFSSRISSAVILHHFTALRKLSRVSTTVNPAAATRSRNRSESANPLLPSLSRYSLAFSLVTWKYSAIRISSLVTQLAELSPVLRCVKLAPSSASGYISLKMVLLNSVVTRQRSASEPSGLTLLGSK